MENLNDKIIGNVITQFEYDQPMVEIQRVIANAGIMLSGSDVNQLAKALSTIVPSASFMDCTSNWPGKILTTVSPHQPVESLVDGMLIRFRSLDDNSNTPPSQITVNVDGQGTRQLRKADSSFLNPGDISPNVDSVIRYSANGGEFLLLNPQSGVVFNSGHIDGFSYRNTVGATTTENSITLEPGSCSAEGGGFNLILPVLTIKDIRDNIDQFLVSGMSPGIDVLARKDRFYRLFVIGGPLVTTTWGIDYAYNLDASLLRSYTGTAVSVAGGYTKYRQIGWISMDGPGYVSPVIEQGEFTGELDENGDFILPEVIGLTWEDTLGLATKIRRFQIDPNNPDIVNYMESRLTPQSNSLTSAFEGAEDGTSLIWGSTVIYNTQVPPGATGLFNMEITRTNLLGVYGIAYVSPLTFRLSEFPRPYYTGGPNTVDSWYQSVDNVGGDEYVFPTEGAQGTSYLDPGNPYGTYPTERREWNSNMVEVTVSEYNQTFLEAFNRIGIPSQIGARVGSNLNQQYNDNDQVRIRTYGYTYRR